MPRKELIDALSRAVTRAAEQPPFSFPDAHPLEPTLIHVPDDLRLAAYADPEISGLEGRIFNQGTLANTFSVHHLLSALITDALQHGVSHAAESLQGFLASDNNRCIDVLLLEGIRVREAIEIVDGVFLCPVDDVPSSTLRKHREFEARAQPSLPLSMAHFFDDDARKPGAALYTINAIKPKFLADISTLQPLSVLPAIYQIAELLVVLGPSSPVTYKSYRELADGELLKGQVGFAWGTARNETRVFEAFEVSSQQIRDFRRTAANYLTLSEDLKRKLRVPLHRLNEAVKHQNNVDRALDLGIALESLLLNHQPSKEQLSLQFRLRGAWLLGENGQHRAELFDAFNKLYSYRSFAAHSGAVAPTKTPEEEVKKTLEAGLSLCADAICKVIDSGGFPAWDRLVVGADYVVEEESNDGTSE